MKIPTAIIMKPGMLKGASCFIVYDRRGITMLRMIAARMVSPKIIGGHGIMFGRREISNSSVKICVTYSFSETPGI